MMWDRIKTLVTPPDLHDDELNRVAGMLYPAAWAILVGVGSLIVIRAFTGALHNIVPLAFVGVGMLAAMAAARRGRTVLAAHIILWDLLVFVDYMIAINDGIHDTAMLIYVAIIILAGLAVAGWQYHAFVAACVASVVVIGALELNGVIHTPMSFKTSVLDIADLATILIISSIVVRLLGNNLLKIIERAREGEAELRLRSDLLTISETRYRALFEWASDGAMILKGQVFDDCNDRTLEIFGCAAREDIIGRSLWDLSPEFQPDGMSSREKAEAIMSNVLNGTPQSYLWQHRRMDGSLFDAEVSLNKIETGAETVLQALVRDVTQRKITERALRASEEKFNKAFQHTLVAMAIQDGEGRFIEVNDTFTEMTGYRREEILGHHPRELNLWNRPEERDAVMRQLTRAGKVKDVEFSFRTRSGEQRTGMYWAEYFDLGGKRFILSTALDITERKEAEEAVRRSDERFRSLFNSIDDAVFVHGLTDEGVPGRFLEANDVASRRLGYSREELLTMSPADIDAPEGLEAVPGAMRKLKTEHHAVWEGVHVAKDGRKIPVEISNHLFEFEGNPTIIATVRDITERRQMEDRLRNSEVHYRTLVEMLPDAVTMIDVHGKLTYVSQKAISVFGSPENVNPLGTIVFDWVAEEHHQLALEALSSIVSANAQKLSYELKLRRYNGEIFWGEVSASPLVDAAGAMTGILLVSRDITEKRQAQEQLLIKDYAIASSISAIGLADMNACVMFVNQAFVNLWGYKDPDEIIGRNIADFAFLGEEETGSVVQAMLDGRGYTAESLGLRADGTTFHLQLSANLVRSKEGAPLCMMASFVDITERKSVETALRQSESSLQAFINALPQPAFLLDREGGLLVANRRFAASMGVPLKDLLGKGLFELLPKDLAVSRSEHIRRAVETRSSIVFEDENAGEHFVNYVEPIVDPLSGSERVAVFALEITERKRMEQALKRSEQDYRGLFENAHDAIIIFEPENEIILDVNVRACELYGYSKADLVGTSLQVLSHDIVKGRRNIDLTLKQRNLKDIETTHYRKDGSTMLLEINASAVNYHGRDAIMSIGRDITERKRMEDALREQEAIYRDAIEQADAVPYRSNYHPHEYTFLGDGIRKMTGYGPGELTPDVWRGIVQEIVMEGNAKGKSREEAVRLAMTGELKQWRSHNRIKDREGNTRWIADAAIQVLDANGIPIGSVGILQDITDRKQWEDQILASLHEKEVLLKEIHHRVKNNLQVVSSLLNLQAAHLKDENVKSIFKESQSRIRSMALVHEYLYRSTDLSRIRFSAYLSRFLSEINRSYVSSAGRVELRTEVGDVMLDISEAIPCGLIVNELVSNSLKYAFPERTKGEICVRMLKGDDGAWELGVKDNGIGIPEEVTISDTPTLGMQLVDSFVRQLRGTISLRRDHGSEFIVRFRSDTRNE